MSTDIPPEITVIPTADGARYLLPRPALAGPTRGLGCVAGAFGLAPIGMGIWFITKILEDFGPPHGPAGFPEVIMILFPLVFVLFGCLMILAGVWVLLGHSEIEVTPDEISSAFRLGPLAWRGRRERRQVRRLVVERFTGGTAPATGLASLTAETDSARPLLLALFYTPAFLRPLAAELAARCGTAAGPLPVQERESNRPTSRQWRRDRLPPPSLRRVGRVLLFVWGCAFLGAGALLLVVILHALIRGDPGNNLQGDYPLKCLWALFPLPFIGGGIFALVHVLRPRNKLSPSPEQQQAAQAATEYPSVPAADHAPGRELAVRLTEGLSPGCGVALLFGVVLLCSGIATPLLAYAANGFWGGGDKENAFLAAFVALFPVIIGALLTGLLVKEWRLWRLGHPVVELSEWPVYCGQTFDVLVTVPGPARYRWLRVAVVCEEHVSYAEGTALRRETRRVHDEPLARHDDLEIERWAPLRVRGRVAVPPGAMHSFKAAHNEVRWLVRVEGEARRTLPLKFTHDYALGVRPAPARGGKP
jgi:hypothetical protein